MLTLKPDLNRTGITMSKDSQQVNTTTLRDRSASFLHAIVVTKEGVSKLLRVLNLS